MSEYDAMKAAMKALPPLFSGKMASPADLEAFVAFCETAFDRSFSSGFVAPPLQITGNIRAGYDATLFSLPPARPKPGSAFPAADKREP